MGAFTGTKEMTPEVLLFYPLLACKDGTCVFKMFNSLKLQGITSASVFSYF